MGVQTNQFPRAFDLARQFRAAGIDVIIGGFHTSGTINMLSDQEPDIQALVKNPSPSYRAKSKRTGRRFWPTRSMAG